MSFEYLKDELSLIGQNNNLGKIAYPIIQETVDEAILFPKGDSEANKLKKVLYEVDNFEICVEKPGKEVFEFTKNNKNPNEPDKTNNKNDMTPCVFEGGIKYKKNLTFSEIWGNFEQFKDLDNYDYLEVLGSVLYRQAWMLDHKRNCEGNWRWTIPPKSLDFLKQSNITINGMTTEVFLYFLEVLALNESVKYFTLGFTNTDKKVGRINNVLTGCHFIAVLINKAPIWNFAGRLSMGVAPITQKSAPEYFPLLRL